MRPPVAARRTIRRRSLRRVLEPYAAAVPGLFLYSPSRAQSAALLRLFVDTAHELTAKPPAVR